MCSLRKKYNSLFDVFPNAVVGCICESVCVLCMRLCVCSVHVAGGGVPQQLWMNRNTETGEASAHGTESSYSKEWCKFMPYWHQRICQQGCFSLHNSLKEFGILIKLNLTVSVNW